MSSSNLRCVWLILVYGLVIMGGTLVSSMWLESLFSIDLTWAVPIFAVLTGLYGAEIVGICDSRLQQWGKISCLRDKITFLVSLITFLLPVGFALQQRFGVWIAILFAGVGVIVDSIIIYIFGSNDLKQLLFKWDRSSG